MKSFVISKEFLDRALIELNFASLKGADLEETTKLIKVLLKECSNFTFLFK